MKLTAFLLLIPALLSSCNNSGSRKEMKDHSKLPYRIDLTKSEPKDLFLSEFAEDVSYVRLESKVVNLGSWVSVDAYSDRFIVTDYHQEFMVFSREGKFLNKVGNIGRGPSEYDASINCQYDPENNKYYVPLTGKDLVLVFNRYGKYEKTFRFTGYSDNMQLRYTRSRFYATGRTVPTDKYYPLAIYKADGTLLKQYQVALPELDEQPTTSPFGTLSLTPGNDVLLAEYSWDTTYLISDSGDWIPYAVYNRGPGQMPEYERFLSGRIRFYAKQLCIASSIRDAGPIITMMVTIPPINYLPAFFKKQTGELFQIKNFGPTDEDKTIGIQNDLDGGPRIIWQYTTKDHHACCLHQAIDLIEWKKSGYFDRIDPKFPEKKEKLFAMIDSLKPDDNPVIMIVKLKE